MNYYKIDDILVDVRKNKQLKAEAYNRKGIYGIYVDDILIYVGKSENICKRWRSHCNHILNLDSSELLKNPFLIDLYVKLNDVCFILNKNITFKVISYYEENSLDYKEKLDNLETYYIKKFKPIYNIDKNDNYSNQNLIDYSNTLFVYIGVKSDIKLNNISDTMDYYLQNYNFNNIIIFSNNNIIHEYCNMRKIKYINVFTKNELLYYTSKLSSNVYKNKAIMYFGNDIDKDNILNNITRPYKNFPFLQFF